jgi:uncharacterized protein YndB with AHSA1/START domain
VRMADRPSTAVAVVIEAPSEAVWSLVSDVTRIGEWGGECEAPNGSRAAGRASVVASGAGSDGETRSGRRSRS